MNQYDEAMLRERVRRLEIQVGLLCSIANELVRDAVARSLSYGATPMPDSLRIMDEAQRALLDPTDEANT